MERARKQMPLHLKVFIGLALGAIIGGAFNATGIADTEHVKWTIKHVTDPIGQIFLRMIFMIVVPLLFSALVLGVAELGVAGKVGRIGWRTLAMTVVLSSLAVALGLLLVNTLKPGVGVDAEKRQELIATFTRKDLEEAAAKSVKSASEAKPFSQSIVEIVPDNPLVSMTNALTGGLLAVMFFALIFGLAMAAIDQEVAAPVKGFLEGVFAISQKVIEFAMRLAPLAVMCLIFKTAAILGVDALAALGKYFFIVLAALAFHQFVIYSVVLRVLARRSPLRFFRQISEVMMTAFATSSSNATLPTALRVAEENVGVPKQINAFVLTIGATGNQNGTALFEGITVLFLAQFFGVDLSLGQQLGVMGLAILAGVGTAGVPGGAWPMIAVILQSYSIPTAGIGLVLGIDRLLDMSRTVLNVTGDITIATCVAEMEARATPATESA